MQNGSKWHVLDDGIVMVSNYQVIPNSVGEFDDPDEAANVAESIPYSKSTNPIYEPKTENDEEVVHC